MALKFAAVVLVPESVPPDVTVQVTPAKPTSFVTVAENGSGCPTTTAPRRGVIDTLTATEVIVSVRFADSLIAVGVVESVTWNFSGVFDTLCVGVPLIAPFDGFSVKPVGSEPEVRLHVYGVVPPVAFSEAEYAALICPSGRLLVVIDNGAAAMTTCNDSVMLWEAASVTFAVKPNVPAAVGVPDNTPAPDSVSPPGSVPALTDHVYEPVPPVAASVAEYAVPTCPLGKVALVIESEAV